MVCVRVLGAGAKLVQGWVGYCGVTGGIRASSRRLFRNPACDREGVPLEEGTTVAGSDSEVRSAMLMRGREPPKPCYGAIVQSERAQVGTIKAWRRRCCRSPAFTPDAAAARTSLQRARVRAVAWTRTAADWLFGIRAADPRMGIERSRLIQPSSRFNFGGDQ